MTPQQIDDAVLIGRRQGLEAAAKVCDQELATWTVDHRGPVSRALNWVKDAIRALIVELPVQPEQTKQPFNPEEVLLDLVNTGLSVQRIAVDEFYLNSSQPERAAASRECKSVPDSGKFAFQAVQQALMVARMTINGVLENPFAPLSHREKALGVALNAIDELEIALQSGIRSPSYRPHEQNAVSEREAFKKWADEYGLEHEPNYSSYTEANCWAAWQARAALPAQEGCKPIELTDQMLRAFGDRHDPYLYGVSTTHLRSIVEDARSIDAAPQPGEPV
jgi:hypothetical protein